MASSRLKEKDLYVAVERWAGGHFGCFATSVNTGTTYGRVDVVISELRRRSEVGPDHNYSKHSADAKS